MLPLSDKHSPTENGDRVKICRLLHVRPENGSVPHVLLGCLSWLIMWLIMADECVDGISALIWKHIYLKQ